MFTKIKNAAIVATAIHLSGVLGHGFVRKVTIDGVEYVYHPTDLFRIQNSLFCFHAASLVQTRKSATRPVAGPLSAYGH